MVRRVGHFAWSELDKSDIDWNIAFFDIPRSADLSPPLSIPAATLRQSPTTKSLSLSLFLFLCSFCSAVPLPVDEVGKKGERKRRENKFQSEK